MKFKSKEHKIPEINTTALPDIILMLLFFFMVTTVMQDASISDINLPVLNNSSRLDVDSDMLEINVSASMGSVLLEVEGDQFTLSESLVQFDHVFTQFHRNGLVKQNAVIYGDGELRMQDINLIKDALRKHNIQNIVYAHARI